MSAQLIYEFALLGSIVRFSDGAPRPPDRHRRKLSAWENNNSGDRLIRKQAERRVGDNDIGASITLHAGDYGSGGVVVLRVRRTFSVDSSLTFVLTERPTVGSIQVLDRPGDDAELVYLANHRADAEQGFTRHGYPNAVLRQISADEVEAAVVEGRAAA